MSVFSKISGHVLNMGDGVVETVYYTPSGGTRTELSAQVIRKKPEQENFRGAVNQRHEIKVYLANDASTGITAVTVNEDRIEVKKEKNDTTYEGYGVKQILSQGADGWVLAIA